MKVEKIKILEDLFLENYPDGFEDPTIQAIVKKHKFSKFNDMTNEFFKKENFNNPILITDNMKKIVSSSSMISIFEKPKFRDFINNLSLDFKELLTLGLKDLLHNNMENGFEILVDLLKDAKLAKWSLITIFLCYMYPKDELFIKPTTTKNILEFFEIDTIKYKPTPSYTFYNDYKQIINELKKGVKKDLAPNNPAFTGFLMMSINTIK